VDSFYVGLVLIGLLAIFRGLSWARKQNGELNKSPSHYVKFAAGVEGEQIKFGHRCFLDSGGGWHTISCSFDGHNLDFYVDGVLLPTHAFIDPEKRPDPMLTIVVEVARKDTPDA
jgi:hypothetical protein